MQLVLGTHEHVAHHHPIAARDDTLLARIQADVRADRRPEPRPLAPHDRSIQIHSCHGRARQVEVLRDAILHLLEEDDTLQPRDVIVMCPDIETFAPLIQATFGAGEVVDDEEFEPLPEELRPTDLRVRLADRSLRQTNPVLGVVAQLIDLAGRRLTASDVLDLADREPVRRRFRLEDEDLARIRDWVADSGIRWGLDADHRAPYKLADLAAGTWRGRPRPRARRRDDDRGGPPPVRGRPAGRRRREPRHRPRRPDGRARRPAAGRGRRLRHRQADHRVGAGARDRRRRPDRHLPARRLAARAAGAHPRRRRRRGRRRAGRAHPARGPRPARRAAAGPPHARELPHRPPDDLHARADALGAAPGRLPARPRRRGVPPQGPARRRRHHARRPARRRPRPAPRGPPDAARRADGGERPPDRHLRGQRRPHQHAAPARRAGRRAARHDRAHRAGRAGGRPPPAPALRPAQLHARRAGRRRAPGASTASRSTARARWSRSASSRGRSWRARCHRDASRCSSSTTSSPSSATRCVRSCASGWASASGPTPTRSPTRCRSSSTASSPGRSASGCSTPGSPAPRADAAVAAERARGELPPGVLADPVIAKLRPDVEQIVGHAAALLPAGAVAGSVDVRVTLPDGRRLNGTVPDVHGDLLRSVTYSRVNPRHRLVAWVRFLALTAAHPDREFEAATVGRAVYGGPREATVSVVRLPRMAPEVALEHLASLATLFDDGMCEPLPLACKTSAAYAEAGSDAAIKEWESGWNFPREDEELEHQLVFGGVLTFEELLARADFDLLRPPAVGRAAGLGAGRVPMTDAFDVCGPLPTGVTVLEASAGTGKTFTIAALAARYVAEGIPLEQTPDGHVHAHGHRRAARARPRAARQRRGGSRGHAARGRRGRAAARDRHAGARSACGASGSRRRSPTSTPPPSPPPTASARRCSAGWACSATSSPTRRSSRTSPTCARRWSTTSTSAASPVAACRSSAARRRWRSRGRRSTTRRRRSSRRTRPRRRSPRCACGWPRCPHRARGRASAAPG